MTRPRLKLGSHLARGVGAVALFAVMILTFLNASFGEPAGFPADAGITAAIGRTMFNLEPAVAGESFLVAFEIVDFVLVAALVGAVLLARRETGGRFSEAFTDGGRDVVDSMLGGDDE
jgi:NADH-quinone oxidoreductase subunit J